jgi:hypothetical protein
MRAIFKMAMEGKIGGPKPFEKPAKSGICVGRRIVLYPRPRMETSIPGRLFVRLNPLI